MMAGMLFRRMVIALAFAAAGAVSVQAQVIYAGPGTAGVQQLWNPQVYGYNVYPYIDPGPYTYSFVVPPSGAAVVPQGYVPHMPVPQPFTYGYPPNLYRPRTPGPYRAPVQPYRGYQPGLTRPRFANPYDSPVPPRQSPRAQDQMIQPQEQDSPIIPADPNGQADVKAPARRRVDSQTKEPGSQGYIMPVPGSRQGGDAVTQQKRESSVPSHDPNRPGN